jgi:UDP-2,4-diacetamido-2,4,6-trideoxy-beta-L-altropyranose hydrolase
MAGLRVAIRADASAARGTGHVVRCLTLASVVKARGGAVTVLGRALPPSVVAAIVDQGHEWLPVSGSDDLDEWPVHGPWSAERQAADAKATIEALRGQAWDWMVVDHYNLDRTWEHQLVGVVRRLLVVDDLADRPHAADVLLDQNLPADRLRYVDRVPGSCRLLLGPDFALIRDEFLAVENRARPRDGMIGRVLVGFGGGDAGALAVAAIDACVQAGFHEGQVDVVVGGLSAEAARVEDRCRQAGYGFVQHTTRMAELMVRADVMIGAGGSSSWERCVVGLPAVVVSLALNQQRVAAGLEAAGAVVSLDNVDCAGAITRVLHDLRRDPARVRGMSASARRLVDGLGAGRVYEVMEATEP